MIAPYCEVEARRAYDRAYYRKNTEKQMENMRRYWSKKAAARNDEQPQQEQNTTAERSQE